MLHIFARLCRKQEPQPPVSKPRLSDLESRTRALQLGYVGIHALNTSGNPDHDEIDMVQEYVANGASLDSSIYEVIRTRKYREGNV